MTPVHKLIINMVNHCYNSAAKNKKTFVQYYQLLPKLSKCCFLLYKPISPSIPITISNIWIINFWWYELQFCLQEDFQVLPEACQVFIPSLNLTFYGLWSYCVVFYKGLFISGCEYWKSLFLDSVTYFYCTHKRPRHNGILLLVFHNNYCIHGP